MLVDVTTWYLEQTSSAQLRPAKAPAPAVLIDRAELPCPEFSRFLYTSVGGDWYWTDRLGWSWADWRAWLDRPGLETWVIWHRGTPAGYAELDSQSDGQVELAYFGLLPAFTGQGLGGHLLSVAACRAWDLATRWPQREATRRVWMHTCSLDGPHALANYQARGFRVHDVKIAAQQVPAGSPGPWPGAGARE